MFRLSRAGCVAAALALTGAVTFVQVATSSAASAAPSRVVSGASATNSIARKSAVAYCPAGTRVYGGGGDIVAGANSVALTGLRPTSVFVNGSWVDSYTATAEEGEVNYLPNWTVYAWAICGPTLPNLSIQWFRATSAAAGNLNTGANCPLGTAPLGLGAEIGNGLGQVVLTHVLGNYTLNSQGTPTGWSSATAYEDQTGYSGTWTLTSYAVCASPPPGLTYQFASSAVNSLDKTASAECPFGTYAYGVGGYLGYNTGELHFDRMVPHGSAWNGGDVDAREDATGFAPNWFTEAETICAK